MSGQEGSQERAAIIEAMRKEAEIKLGRFAQHEAYLDGLQEHYGFNLDVAHALYGDTLLHPDYGGVVAHRWGELLGAISDNPGKPLVVLDKQVAGIQNRHTIADSRHVNPDFSDRYFAIGIPNVTLDDFFYKTTEEATLIGLRYDQLLQVGTPAKDYRRQLTTPAEDESPELLILGYRGRPVVKPQIDFMSQQLTVVYNPSDKELLDLATDSSLFSIFDWRDALRTPGATTN